MSKFWGPFFLFSWSKNIYLFFYENIVGSALKSCIEGKLVKVKKKREEFLTGENPFFFRAKNFNMSTKIRWSVLCGLLLCLSPSGAWEENCESLWFDLLGKIWHKIHACEIANEKQLREAEGFYTKVRRILKFHQKDLIQKLLFLVKIWQIGKFNQIKINSMKDWSKTSSSHPSTFLNAYTNYHNMFGHFW